MSAGRARGVVHLTAALVGLAIALAVVVTLLGRSPDAGADAAAREARVVRELDRVERQALVAGDANRLDRILAPDFVYVPPPGDRGSRSDYVGAVASGDLDYQAFDAISPVQVRISGTMAVVTYESHLSVTAGALHVEHDAWHTHVYEKDQGDWRQVWAQATAVGGFPPSGG